MDLKPSQVIVILGVFLIIFLGIFWTVDQQTKYQGVTLLHADERHLNIVIGHRILRYDADGYVSTVNLHDLGIQDLVGGIEFFENGDLLVRSQSKPLSFFDNIAVYLRKSVSYTMMMPD